MASQDELTRDSGVTIVTERRHHTVVIGAAIAILVAGTVAADANPYSTAKRIGVAAFFAVFIALCVVIWIAVNRRRNRTEVADDAIRYVHRSGRTHPGIPGRSADRSLCVLVCVTSYSPLRGAAVANGRMVTA